MPPSIVDATSISLLDRVRASDPQAWTAFCRLYAPLVYGWARQVGLQDEDAADVGQEVFRTVATRIETFERLRHGSLRRWLWTITRNKLGDYMRLANRTPQAPGGSSAYHHLQQLPDSPPDDASEATGSRTRASVLHAALQLIQSEIEPTTWQIFWRSTVDGDSTDEIARDLGMTGNAIRQAKFRVLRRLRRELDGVLDETP
ncbi:MAG: sigma-70 family RNA polymerase sigma factor [Planctomycetota bacterium]|nr:sigma-70 family RNA polymerase sigma factor [Planctomycetota bacterium]